MDGWRVITAAHGIYWLIVSRKHGKLCNREKVKVRCTKQRDREETEKGKEKKDYFKNFHKDSGQNSRIVHLEENSKEAYTQRY